MSKLTQDDVAKMRRVMRCLIEHADRTTSGYEIHNHINNEVVDFPEVMEVYAKIKHPKEDPSYFITASPVEHAPRAGNKTTLILTDDEVALVEDALSFSRELANDAMELYQSSKEVIEKSFNALDKQRKVIINTENGLQQAFRDVIAETNNKQGEKI